LRAAQAKPTSSSRSDRLRKIGGEWIVEHGHHLVLAP
jgi:hypothetical protein